MMSDDVFTRLEAAICEAGGRRAWANRVGVSVSYVSMLLNGKRRPSKRVLDALGLELKLAEKTDV
jgi:hypothetical protein